MTETNSSRRWLRNALIGVGVAAAIGLTACTSTNGTPAASGTGDKQVAGDQSGGQTKTQNPAKVAFAPGASATDVSPTDAIKVSVTNGSISDVALTNADGKKVAGQLSPDKASFTVTEPLGFGKTYTWSGNAVGSDGKAVPIQGSFTTVKPRHTVHGSLNTADNATYGVAMPIAVTFDAAVKDKAAVEKALTVQTSVPTEGSWAWLDDRTVHWRPQAYFQPGTVVTVAAKLYGINFGNGYFGSNDVTSKFTIGRAQVVKANTQTHRWVVYRDGALVADMPSSFGLDSDPGRVTKSGTHVVMGKYPTYKMTNPKYHYENVEVQWAVRISNNGEFSHSAPWSVGQQGKSNVSHGCANLSPANAKAFYDTAMIGDPVEIVGTNQQLGSADGDYYDWALTWSQWKAKSAL